MDRSGPLQGLYLLLDLRASVWKELLPAQGRDSSSGLKYQSPWNLLEMSQTVRSPIALVPKDLDTPVQSQSGLEWGQCLSSTVQEDTSDQARKDPRIWWCT